MVKSKVKHCPSCQNANPQDARFCDHCGHKLEPKSTTKNGKHSGRSHQITTIDASSGGVVAVGSNAKAVNVGQGGTYIERQEGHTNEDVADTFNKINRCPKCEQEVKEKAKFCQHCGNML